MPGISRRWFLGSVPVGVAALGPLVAGKQALPAGCRDAMLQQLGSPDVWSAAKSVGAEVIEVSVDDPFDLPLLSHPGLRYSVATREGIRQLSGDLQAAERKISAFCVASHFDVRPGFERDFNTRLAGIAQQMGIRAIRIDVVSYKVPAAQFLETAVPAMKALIDATEGIDIRFGIENHGPTGNDPVFLLPLLERVGSKRLGVTLDTGNLYWFGHPLSKVYEMIEMMAPHAVHTHCKNIRYPEAQREVRRPMGWEYARYEAPVEQGDIDFGRVVKILRAAGYSGDLCVENESLHKLPEGERSAVLAGEIAYLKRL